MSTFTDAKGRSWTIRLDVPLLRRIHNARGVNLADLRADPLFELSIDPIKLVDVLYLCCEKQAKKDGVTDEEFGESLGENIDAAVAALEEAITDFFPESKRSLLRSLREKNRRMQTNAMAKAMEELDTNEAEIEKRMGNRVKEEMRKMLDAIDSGPSEDGGSAT